jgi:hypothetical protein
MPVVFHKGMCSVLAVCDSPSHIAKCDKEIALISTQPRTVLLHTTSLSSNQDHAPTHCVVVVTRFHHLG